MNDAEIVLTNVSTLQLPENNACKNCGRSLEKSNSKILCKDCSEMNLFAQVKEYIRAQDVTEFEVALNFHIPLRLVKKWINEGRIEYKQPKLSVAGTCRRCNDNISFGNYCPNCLHFLESEHSGNEFEFDRDSILDMLQSM